MAGFNWVSREANLFTGAEFRPDRKARPVSETGHPRWPKGQLSVTQTGFQHSTCRRLLRERRVGRCCWRFFFFFFIFNLPADILSTPIFHNSLLVKPWSPSWHGVCISGCLILSRKPRGVTDLCPEVTFDTKWETNTWEHVAPWRRRHRFDVFSVFSLWY